MSEHDQIAQAPASAPADNQISATLPTNELSSGGQFVQERIVAGESLNQINSNLLGMELPQEDIDTAIFDAGNNFADSALKSGGSFQDITKTLVSLGYDADQAFKILDGKDKPNTLDNRISNFIQDKTSNENMQVDGVRSEMIAKGFTTESVEKGVISAGLASTEQALISGIPFDRLRGGLKSQGYSPAEINAIELKSLSTTAGLEKPSSEEAQLNFLNGLLETSKTNPENFDIAELDANYNLLFSKYSTRMKEAEATLFPDSDAKWAAQKENITFANKYSEGLNKFGVPSKVVIDNVNLTADIMVQSPGGDFVPLDLPMYDSIVSDLQANGINLAATTAAAFTGFGAGFAATPKLPIPYVGWLAKPIIGLTTSAVAAGSAAFAGTGVDIFRNSLAMNLDIKKELILSQAAEAGIFEAGIGATGGLVLAGGLKLAKVAYNAVKGNATGSAEALSRYADLSAEQVKDKLDEYTDLVGLKREKTLLGKTKGGIDEEARILSQTEPNLDPILASAISSSPLDKLNVVKAINARAQDVMNNVSTADIPDVGRTVNEELRNYTRKVKKNYADVKMDAVELVDKATNYSFDYDKIALQPVLDKIDKLVTGFGKEKFTLALENMKSLGAYNKKAESTGFSVITGSSGKPSNIAGNHLRSFKNLLDLRVAVNQMAGDSSFKAIASNNGVKEVIDSIDNEILNVSKSMEGGEEWLSKWEAANIEYSKYLKVKEISLFKGLTREGVTPKQAIQELATNIGDIDNVFMQVVETLPPPVRVVTERAILENFVEKYTAGKIGGNRAINFPLLDRQLQQLTFTTPENRNMVRAINRLARVFKNDVNAGLATGQVQLTQFQAILGTDPTVRAKLEIARLSFGFIKKRFPTDQAKVEALISKVETSFRDPLNHNNIKEIQATLGEDKAMTDELLKLRTSYGQFGTKKDYSSVDIYRNATEVDAAKVTEGELGRGVYYKVSQEAAGAAKGAGVKQHAFGITPERIATEQDIKNIMKVENITIDEIANNPNIRKTLIDGTYLGLRIGDDVMIF